MVERAGRRAVVKGGEVFRCDVVAFAVWWTGARWLE